VAFLATYHLTVMTLCARASVVDYCKSLADYYEYGRPVDGHDLSFGATEASLIEEMKCQV
jgi:hypothetical protein